MYATDKQLAYIIDLWNQARNGSAKYLSQTDLPLSRREKAGDMTKAAASTYIAQLKKELGQPVTSAPARRRTTRTTSTRRGCITGGNCSSFGTGSSCGASDCDGY